ncbi:flagellar basal body P-ring formation chaperone FlgA [Silvimonas amylolytica]|uniref:Flagella basal body P-ring formation protein FlgA n=1 Tax=Silvimonas amylolytica TaxID=449663 RepID=A0ABQ2PGI6_9NEIS|nr:flagellar basal body P-ring formation chaperone FlgA [Silvimonas amylolytica]GGP24315.1 flagellar basal body P-ring biosynthesis protein FlgA [Silvimonas amylolytica]
MRTLLVILGFLVAAPVFAGGQVDLATIQRTAASWLDQQLSQYQGQSSYVFGKLDSRLRLDACNAMDVKAAPGYRLAGNSMLRVTCVDGAMWAINLPVKISVQATYYVAAKPLAAGHELVDGDLAPQQGDLGQLPGSVILDPSSALGRTLSAAVAAGAAVRAEMLRAPIIIQQGQKVRVLIRVGDIEVSNDGYAMNNASEGQNVRVRVGTSTIVQGIARPDGSVQVTE